MKIQAPIQHKGFTLLEILIALSIFAILATITSSTMYYAFNSRARATLQAEELSNIQLALAMIERDITQAVEREVRTNEMHIKPIFLGNKNYMEFTRGGVINPNQEEKQSTLQRIAFLCRNNQLVRYQWERLDTTERKRFHVKTLLKNLSSCNFSYLNQSLQLLSDWQAHAMHVNQQAEHLPKAIQVNLTIKKWGKMSSLFIIPGALYGYK